MVKLKLKTMDRRPRQHNDSILPMGMKLKHSFTLSAAQFTPGEWQTYQKKHPGVDQHNHKVVPAEKRGPKADPVKERSRTQKGKEKDKDTESKPKSSVPEGIEKFIRDKDFRQETLKPLLDLLQDPPESALKALKNKSIAEAIEDITVKTLSLGPMGESPEWLKSFSEFITVQLALMEHHDDPDVKEAFKRVREVLQEGTALDTVLEQLRGDVKTARLQNTIAGRVWCRWASRQHQRSQEEILKTIWAVYQRHHEDSLGSQTLEEVPKRTIVQLVKSVLAQLKPQVQKTLTRMGIQYSSEDFVLAWGEFTSSLWSDILSP